jgi:hypothetical protein
MIFTEKIIEPEELRKEFLMKAEEIMLKEG